MRIAVPEIPSSRESIKCVACKSFRIASICAFYAWKLIVFMGLEGKPGEGYPLCSSFFLVSSPFWVMCKGPAKRRRAVSRGCCNGLRRWLRPSFFDCAPGSRNYMQGGQGSGIRGQPGLFRGRLGVRGPAGVLLLHKVCAEGPKYHEKARIFERCIYLLDICFQPSISRVRGHLRWGRGRLRVMCAGGWWGRTLVRASALFAFGISWAGFWWTERRFSLPILFGEQKPFWMS